MSSSRSGRPQAPLDPDVDARYIGHLRREYGPDAPRLYNVQLERQGGLCAVVTCRRGPGRGKHLKVDEDKRSSPWRIRGLLCQECNRKATDGIAAYLSDPPAADLEWSVPSSIEQRRTEQRAAARAKPKAPKAGREAPGEQTTYSSRITATGRREVFVKTH